MRRTLQDVFPSKTPVAPAEVANLVEDLDPEAAGGAEQGEGFWGSWGGG